VYIPLRQRAGRVWRLVPGPREVSSSFGGPDRPAMAAAAAMGRRANLRRWAEYLDRLSLPSSISRRRPAGHGMGKNRSGAAGSRRRAQGAPKAPRFSTKTMKTLPSPDLTEIGDRAIPRQRAAMAVSAMRHFKIRPPIVARRAAQIPRAWLARSAPSSWLRPQASSQTRGLWACPNAREVPRFLGERERRHSRKIADLSLHDILHPQLGVGLGRRP